jgi:hypothetical protein
MQYGKIENGQLIYPPYIFNNIYNYSGDTEKLEKDGWKPLVYVDDNDPVFEGATNLLYLETDECIYVNCKLGIDNVDYVKSNETH